MKIEYKGPTKLGNYIYLSLIIGSILLTGYIEGLA